MYEYISIVKQNKLDYSNNPPFNPPEKYPEYPFESGLDSTNEAYTSVRETFHLLNLDIDNYGTSRWNPLGSLIKPGETVLIKPNLLRESHSLHPQEWKQIITHGSIIRAVADYALIALQGRGRLIIADGPQYDSDFNSITLINGLNEIIDFYSKQNIQVELLDLRRERWNQKDGVIKERFKLPGDPVGYVHVDLGRNSEFSSYMLNAEFYGADYDYQEVRDYHHNGRHEYIICRTAIDADVVINLPKLKTHKKTGVTLSLKNFVGINGYRNCLPHHTVGTPKQGGDEFPNSTFSNKIQSEAIIQLKRFLVFHGNNGGFIARFLFSLGRFLFGPTHKKIRSGNWYGNDTTWRMVLDLNKIFFHFNGDGNLRSRPIRYMTIIDGIIAGEGNGPENADARPVGLIIAGHNPVAADTVCTTLMGLDYHKIPVISKAWSIKNYPLIDVAPYDIRCVSNINIFNGSLNDLRKSCQETFLMPIGWRNKTELENDLYNHAEDAILDS
jgi:uncharacterized protein (DUF362 family)